MNIAILGASGYLGRRLVDVLDEDDHIICLVRKETNISHLRKKDNIEIIEIEDFIKSNRYVDCVINLCCRYIRGGITEKEIIESNLIVPLLVLENAIKQKTSKFITIDTGLPDDFNIYCLTKSKFADFGRWWVKNVDYELSFYNLLLENYYGENEPNDRFIPSVIEKLKANQEVLLTEGTQMRDFVYVDDVTMVIKKLLKCSVKGYMDIPVGSGQAPAIREVVLYLKEILGSNSDLKFGAIEKRKNEPNSVADISVLQKLGIEIKYGWREGFLHII